MKQKHFSKPTQKLCSRPQTHLCSNKIEKINAQKIKKRKQKLHRKMDIKCEIFEENSPKPSTSMPRVDLNQLHDDGHTLLTHAGRLLFFQSKYFVYFQLNSIVTLWPHRS